MADKLTEKGLELYRAWRNKLPVGQEFADEAAFQRYFIDGTPEQMAEYMASLGIVKGEAAYNSMLKAFEEIKKDGPVKYGADLFNNLKSKVERLSADVDRAGGIKEWLAKKTEENKNELPGYGGLALGFVGGYAILSELFGDLGVIGKTIIGALTAVVGYFAAMKMTGGGIAMEQKLTEKPASQPQPTPPLQDVVPPINYQGQSQKPQLLGASFAAPQGIELPSLNSVTVAAVDEVKTPVQVMAPVSDKSQTVQIST